jgi:hypothetical protein
VARERTEVAREKMSGATRDDMKDERVEMRRGDEERETRVSFHEGLSLPRAKARMS